MKILLDECVTKKLKRHFPPEFEVATVTESNLSGFKNGKLLAAAEKLGFDVLLTVDKNLQNQQKISRFSLTLVVLDVQKINITFMLPLLPRILKQLPFVEKGKVYFFSFKEGL